MSVHRAIGLDLAGASASWTLSERGLVADVVPVWAGVREDGGLKHFRDPAQIKAPGFLRTLERAPLVIGHPVDSAGRVVYLASSAPQEGEALAWTGGEAAIYPHAAYQVGQLGDSIAWDERDGIEVPRLRATMTHPRAIGYTIGIGGTSPRREVSLGFFRHVIAEPGEWTAPSGEKIAYDVEQIIDPDDPRAPPELKPWIGANYLGIGFAAGQSRGEYTRFGVDARLDVPGRRGDGPRTFYLIRQADETGVSGTGHVLDGVVWPDGKVTTKWCAEGPSEINVSESFAEWDAIHVSKHPGNASLVIFDDGGEPPSPLSRDNPPDEGDQSQEEYTMDLEAAMKMIEELKAANAMLKAEVEKMKAGGDKAAADMEAMSEEKTKLAAAVDAKTQEIAKLHAELEPVRKATRDAKAAEVAKRTGVDAKALDAVSLDDLEIAAMKERIKLGLDAAPAAEYADSRVYLRARYDMLKPADVSTTPPGGVSDAFRRAVGGDSNVAPQANADKPQNSMSALP